MLKDVAKASSMDDSAVKALRAEQGTRLMVLQQRLRQAKIPVIICFEGWDASGKGSAIGDLISNLDPRGFKVFTMDLDDPEEERFPYMHRYWRILPLYGNMAILDGSWYRGVADRDVRPDDKDKLAERYRQISDFESQLTADGYVVVKFFLHITKKEQKKRFEQLEENSSTSWRVTHNDWKQHKHYDEQFEIYDDMLARSSYSFAPWTVLHATDKRQVASQIYAVLISRLEAALKDKEALISAREAAKAAEAEKPAPEPQPLKADRDEITGGFGKLLVRMPQLATIALDKEVAEEQYRAELKEAQKRLARLHNELYLTKTPVVLGFEGWEAAGKGGAIKRLTRALDPRGFEVIPTAAPNQAGLNHHYLWRFWNALPKDGHIAVFDRTWYGRVMVERLEHLTPIERCMQAYAEINQFERSLYEWGAVVIKFWLQIDSDEQLRRFTDRQNTPEKQWKITDEDWRNRDKWPQYEVAVNEMLQLTSTQQAPWVIIESNDKKYARLKVLETVIDAMEKKLD